MADMKNIYATLDIGTNNIKAVVAEVYEGKVFVLASSTIISEGIEETQITNYDLVSDKVKKVIDSINNKLGVDIKKVIVGIPAHNVSIARLYGETYITNETGIIKPDDLQRAIVNTTNKYDVENYEIVNAIPLRYNVDGYVSKKAIGEKANKLGCEIMALTGPIETIIPYLKVVEDAGLEVQDICLSPLAEQYEVLINEPADNSAIVMNIGFSTTSISINYQGELKGVGTFGIGVRKVVESLVTRFKISYDDALTIISDYGISNEKMTQESISVKLLDDSEINVNMEEVLSYSNHVMMSLLITLRKELEKYDLTNYEKIIVTGGCCHIDGIDSLFQKVFSDFCEVYKPMAIGARNPIYTTSLGLVRYFDEKNRIRNRQDSSMGYDEQVKFTTPKKKVLNITDDTVIGKLFEFFNDKE